MKSFSFGIVFLAAMYIDVAFPQSGSTSGPFGPYMNCTLPGGPSIVETAPLAPGIQARTVTTLQGPVQVPLLEGRRLMFAYPDEDFYANVKVEALPTDSYLESKAALVADFEHTLASGDSSRNYNLKPTLNGFDLQGLDRSKREGGVLGIYLLFDDVTHMVTTIYFLNQEPPKRFKTIEEYGMVRDRFLNAYTSCIHSGRRAGSDTKPTP